MSSGKVDTILLYLKNRKSMIKQGTSFIIQKKIFIIISYFYIESNKSTEPPTGIPFLKIAVVRATCYTSRCWWIIIREKWWISSPNISSLLSLIIVRWWIGWIGVRTVNSLLIWTLTSEVPFPRILLLAPDIIIDFELADDCILSDYFLLFKLATCSLCLG